MRRRTFLQILWTIPWLGRSLAALAETGGSRSDARNEGTAGAGASGLEVEPLELPREVWRERLPPAEFSVLFEGRTERPHSSPLNVEKRTGTFVCAACNLPLFRSRDKFESGTGWPSFTRPIEGHVGTQLDFKIVLPRTEYHCARCGGHQGHVFEDGPPPTGQRWCNNGIALHFVPEGEPLPGLPEWARS
jgi:peptide-methionine (R)-S-oxide reductase